ncbi:GNAT family N-acetyltransferase [Phytoactinopolyspora limicola]|uniref:GNAT family N-acetyltransferase n=1 Tax=Phytoactinopolyspora limicola TaxID=2715536 RepID=UPI00140E5C5E|nr:GNAT family N-acetyltransferase [Phytoactinopolyspora limicola]
MSTAGLTIRPLTPDTWNDFEAVMGTNGGARGCWCMHWRLSMQEWMAGKGNGNKAAMRRLAAGTTPPGVVAYVHDEPIAWCGFGERSDFPRMQRSALLKPVDDEPVISLTCLFVKKGHRGTGRCSDLIAAVCSHLAETAEVRTVEAYPVEPETGRTAGADTAMTGIASAFRAAGFTEVARPRSDRPVMRYSLR